MIVAIIPARGGRKRIPYKNIRPFLGKLIMAYLIEAANANQLFDRVIVSTDDAEIAAIAGASSAVSPFVRCLIYPTTTPEQMKSLLMHFDGSSLKVNPQTWLTAFMRRRRSSRPQACSTA
jgi:CMP-N-acetylneuraminic acid synthetase